MIKISGNQLYENHEKDNLDSVVEHKTGAQIIMQQLAIGIVAILFFTTMIMAQPGDGIIGQYHLSNQLDLEIFKADGKYFGKIIGLDGFNGGQKKDIHNPDRSSQAEPLLGKVIIENLEYDQSINQWIKGRMYGPEKGLIFNLKIVELRAVEIEVVASKFFFRKTLVWQKL